MKRWLSVLLALAVLVVLLPGMPQADAVTMDVCQNVIFTGLSSTSSAGTGTHASQINSYFSTQEKATAFAELLYYLSDDDVLIIGFSSQLYRYWGFFWNEYGVLQIGVYDNPNYSNEVSLLGVYSRSNLSVYSICEVVIYHSSNYYPVIRSLSDWPSLAVKCLLLYPSSIKSSSSYYAKTVLVSDNGVVGSNIVGLFYGYFDVSGNWYYGSFGSATFLYEAEDPETPEFTILFRDADIWKYEQGEYGYYYIMSDTPLNGAGTVDFYINGAQVATQDVVVGATGFWYCEYALPTDQIGSYEVYAVVHNTLNGAVASATAPTKTVNIVEAGSSGGSSGGTGDSGGSGSGTTDGSLLAGIDYMLDELWQDISGAFADLGNKLSSWWNRLFGDLGDIKELLGNQSGGSDSAQLDEIQDAVDDVPNQVVDGMGDLMEQEKNNATVEGDSNAGALLDSIPDPSADMTGALNTLVSVLSYEGTAAVLTTPRVYLPAMNNVTQEVLLLGSQEINFEEYIALMPSYVIALIQALFDVAIVGFCMKELIEMVQLLASGVQKNEGS